MGKHEARNTRFVGDGRAFNKVDIFGQNKAIRRKIIVGRRALYKYTASVGGNNAGLPLLNGDGCLYLFPALEIPSKHGAVGGRFVKGRRHSVGSVASVKESGRGKPVVGLDRMDFT